MKITEKQRARWVSRARAKFQEEGTVEIDDKAEISTDDPKSGAYVQAWVWVYADDPEEGAENV